MSTEFFAFEGAEPAPAEPTTTPQPQAVEVVPESAARVAAEDSLAVPGTWEGDIAGLQTRFPGTRLGTLFCIHKLEQDADLKLRDFKAEAELRGVALSGRSYHGARVLLGLEAPTPRRTRVVEAAEVEAVEDEATGFADVDDEDLAPTGLAATGGTDLESALRTAIDAAASQRTGRMRDAIRRAIAVLEEALED
jgi:hypothetical protein